MRTPALILTVLLTAACSSGGSDSPATSSAPSISACSEAVKDGAIVTDALVANGCLDSNGATRRGTARQCKNGQQLWSMNGLMGMSGEAMVPANQKKSGDLTAKALFELACVS